jgi:hypothetical protein
VWAKRLEEGTCAVPFGKGDEPRYEITAQKLGAVERHGSECRQAAKTLSAKVYGSRIKSAFR